MALPDIKAAIIEKLLAEPVVTAVSSNIGSVHRQSWGAEPEYMLLLRLAGTPGDDNWYEIGFHSTRIDMAFHAATPDLAMGFWRTVHPVICPDQSDSTLRHAFNAENCRVIWMEKEAGPFEIMDPVTNREFVEVSYVVVWAGLPLA